MRSCFRPRALRLFWLYLLLVSVMPACGATKSPAEETSPREAPAVYTWDHVCDSTSERLNRCPEEAKVDGKFARTCVTASNDRSCFNTFNETTAHFLMNCIHDTPCNGKGSIFGNCAEDLFTKVTLDAQERQKQDRCRARMDTCNLKFKERCIAPFLKAPLRAQVWACLEMPCDTIRRCTEGVLEQVGCR